MIKSLWLGSVENPMSDNTDALMELEDGRRFAFTVFTPLGLMAAMDRDKSGHIVIEDLLVVASLSELNVRAALEEILSDHCPERFGTLQE